MLDALICLSENTAILKDQYDYISYIESIVPIEIKEGVAKIGPLCAITCMMPMAELFEAENKKFTTGNVLAFANSIISPKNSKAKNKHIVLSQSYIESQITRHDLLLSTVLNLNIYFLANKDLFTPRIADKIYYECISYLTLLNVVIAHNMVILLGNSPEHQERKKKHLAKCEDWLTIFEMNYLSKVGLDFCQELRQLLVSKITTLKYPLPPVELNKGGYPTPYLLVNELKNLVALKNQRAARFGDNCERIVVHSPASHTFSQVEYLNLEKVRTEVEKLIKTKSMQCLHFLFYANHDFGPVELLSVRYNQQKMQLELVNVHASNTLHQRYFLLSILATCKTVFNVPYQLLACQANLMPADSPASQFYAYALSSALASVPFEKLNDKKYKTSQPAFYNWHEKELQERDVVDNIYWFDITALGNKAILLAPTYEAMKTLFERQCMLIFGETKYKQEAAAKCSFYMRKYNLAFREGVETNPYQEFFEHYYEYAYHRAKMKLLGHTPDLSLMEIKAQVLDDDFNEHELFAAVKELQKQFKQLKLTENADKKPTAIKIEKPVETKVGENPKAVIPEQSKKSQKSQQGRKTGNGKRRRKPNNTNANTNAAKKPVEQKTETAEEKQLVVVDWSKVGKLKINKGYKQEDGKVMRRAASGYCPLAHFEILLNHPSMSINAIDEFDPGRQYNPLLCALTKNNPKQALLLLEKGAKTDLINIKGKTAEDIYRELPAHCAVKRNSRIAGYFK